MIKIETPHSKFECEKQDSYWRIEFAQLNGVSGEIHLPHAWSLTRVVQYLEVIDSAL